MKVTQNTRVRRFSFEQELPGTTEELEIYMEKLSKGEINIIPDNEVDFDEEHESEDAQEAPEEQEEDSQTNPVEEQLEGAFASANDPGAALENDPGGEFARAKEELERFQRFKSSPGYRHKSPQNNFDKWLKAYQDSETWLKQ